MITPEIRYFHSPDADDLSAFKPTDERFSLLVQMVVGPSNGEGEESFDVQVVTPQWLEDRCSTDGPMSGRHLVVVCHYDWPALERYLRAQLASCAAGDWAEVAQRLGRLGRWEFEDQE
jgi:Immunity protein 8